MNNIIIIRDYRDSKRLLKEDFKKGVLTLEIFSARRTAKGSF